MDLEAHKIPPDLPQAPRRGYASLSEFIASDKCLYIFRRFDSLATRNLLYMQDEICEIEQQIDALDNADVAAGRLYSLHTRNDENAERVALIQKSMEKLRIYEKTLLRRSRLLALAKPTERNVSSLLNWVAGIKPTVEEESHFLDPGTDLAALSVQESDALENFLGKYCYKLFITKKHRSKPHAVGGLATVHYFSFTSIRYIARLLVTVSAVFAITGPTFALFLEKRTLIQLALIVVFSLVFAMLLIFTTSCKNQEMFAIIAAYAAVMIVFVGNGPSSTK